MNNQTREQKRWSRVHGVLVAAGIRSPRVLALQTGERLARLGVTKLGINSIDQHLATRNWQIPSQVEIDTLFPGSAAFTTESLATRLKQFNRLRDVPASIREIPVDALIEVIFCQPLGPMEYYLRYSGIKSWRDLAQTTKEQLHAISFAHGVPEFSAMVDMLFEIFEYKMLSVRQIKPVRRLGP